MGGAINFLTSSDNSFFKGLWTPLPEMPSFRILAKALPCSSPFRGFPVTSELSLSSGLVVRAFHIWPRHPVSHSPLESAHSLCSARIEFFFLLFLTLQGSSQRCLRPPLRNLLQLTPAESFFLLQALTPFTGLSNARICLSGSLFYQLSFLRAGTASSAFLYPRCLAQGLAQRRCQYITY